MPKFVVTPQGEVWDRLRVEVTRLASLASGETVDLNQLGKALAAVVTASLSAFDTAGLPSVRMRAAAKALDLTTKKSELEHFVGP
jgi:hypothetical protein